MKYNKVVKVKSVRRITLDSPVPVYDATSPVTHNFCLGNGVIVHNTCSKARSASYQEILPQKGKIDNVYKTEKGLWDKEEIVAILQSIGYDPRKKDFQIRVNRIILLSDADDSGFHINCLNLSLLSKFIPQVFNEGRVFIVRAYEFVIEHDDGDYYADSITEMKKIAPPKFHKSIQHVKGWAELGPRGLAYMAFDKATRKLINIKIKDGCIEAVKEIMGKDSDMRKQLILEE